MKYYIIALCLYISSCKEIYKLAGLYKTPVNQSDSKVVLDFKKKIKEPVTIIRVNSAKNFKNLSREVRSVPYTAILDRQMNILISDSTSNCPWLNLKSIDEIFSKKSYMKKFDINIFKDYTYVIDGDSNFLSQTKCKYYFLFTYASYVPNKSKEIIKEIKPLVNRYSDSVCFIALNLDLSDKW